MPREIVHRYGIDDLRGGDSILAAGQLSERWAIANGRAGKRSVILAELAHAVSRSDPGEPVMRGAR